MKKKISILFYCLLSLGVYAQKDKRCKYYYRLDIIPNIDIHLDLGTENSVQPVKDTICKIYLNDCKGEITVKVFFNDTIQVVLGQYVNTGIMDSSISKGYNPVTEEWILDTYIYYIPLRHGKWKYWNINGELIREEYWEKGTLLREEEY